MEFLFLKNSYNGVLHLEKKKRKREGFLCLARVRIIIEMCVGTSIYTCVHMGVNEERAQL